MKLLLEKIKHVVYENLTGEMAINMKMGCSYCKAEQKLEDMEMSGNYRICLNCCQCGLELFHTYDYDPELRKDMNMIALGIMGSIVWDIKYEKYSYNIKYPFREELLNVLEK